MAELNHSSLSLPSMKAPKRSHGNIEVWANPPNGDDLPMVVVTFPHNSTWESVDITPNEARAFAALLINAAEQQAALSKAGA